MVRIVDVGTFADIQHFMFRTLIGRNYVGPVQQVLKKEEGVQKDILDLGWVPSISHLRSVGVLNRVLIPVLPQLRECNMVRLTSTFLGLDRAPH